MMAAGEQTQTERDRLGGREILQDRDSAGGQVCGRLGTNPGIDSGVFAAASDVGSEGKAGVQEDPQGRWQGTWGDEATVTGCHQVLSHQKKGQDWQVKTMSGETPLTQKKPLTAQCFFTLIMCRDERHSTRPPRLPPTQHSHVLSEATLAWAPFRAGAPAFSRALLRSLPRSYLSTCTTVRHLSCPARPPFWPWPCGLPW